MRGKFMKKRLLSMAMALIIVLGMMPAELFSVFALTYTDNGGKVYYSREIPEVAILNGTNGYSTTFWSSLNGAEKASDTNDKVSPYPQYNAMRRLYGKDWDYVATFDGRQDSLSYNIPWASYNVDGSAPSYQGSSVKKIMEASRDIEMLVGAKFKNYEHEHTWGSFWNKKGAEVNIGLSMTVRMGGCSSRTLYGQSSLGKATNTYSYSGNDEKNMEYKKMTHYNDSDNYITFTRDTRKITDSLTCSCIVATASEFLITLRDASAPEALGVEYSTDGGSTWINRYSTLTPVRLRAGANLKIRVTYDEPIRFADDSASGKEKLYLGLMRNGKDVDDNHKAYLYKLDGSALYFDYTVPDMSSLSEDEKEEVTISGLSQDALFGGTVSNPTVDLVQVCRLSGKKTSFKITSPDKNEYGYSKTNCNITDIAGNAPNNTILAGGNLSIDTKTPVVKTVRFSATVNNADVKKAKADNGTEEGIDDSDKVLGDGDTLDAVVVMSEALDLSSTGIWNNAVAETNIIAPEGYTPPQGVKLGTGNLILISSRYFMPPTPKNNQLSPTEFTLYSLPIVEGMTVKAEDTNPQKEVRVNKFYFENYSDSITDVSGNPLDKTNVGFVMGANSNAYRLDTAPPTLTGKTYISLDTYNGFCYPVEIDKGSGTEVRGIYGKFKLDHAGDNRSYKFKWAASSNSSISSIKTEDWHEGWTGVEYDFLQHDTTYFYVCADGNDYENLDICTLSVKAKDYAGNIGKLTADSSIITWYIDNVPPTINAGKTERRLNGDQGEISADVTLFDSHKIKSWEYAWGTSETVAPTSGWQPGGLDPSLSSENTITVTAREVFAEGTKFDAYLWVKAVDNSNVGNTATVNVGHYVYDLSDVSYGMTHSPAIAKRAEIKVDALGANDALVFIAPIKAEEDKYAVRVFEKGETAENIFTADGWHQYYVRESNGAYEFERYSTADPMYSVANGEFYGDYDVRMISVKADGITRADDGKLEKIDGSLYSYTVGDLPLRVASDNPWRNYSVYQSEEYITPEDFIKISSSEDWAGKNRELKWSQTVLPTLAGVTFDINIRQDNNGWECADIDTAGSKLVLKNRLTNEEKESPLGVFVPSEDGVGYTQKVTATGEYETGIYDVILRLKLVTGDEHDFVYEVVRVLGGIVVDATEPNANLKISSIKYDKYSIYWLKIMNIDDDIYPEREFAGEEIMYLPVAGGYFDRENISSRPYTDGIYNIIFTSDGEGKLGKLYNKNQQNQDVLHSYTGQYYIEAWNGKSDYADKKVKFYPSNEDLVNVKNEPGTGFTTLSSFKDDPNFVYLESDVENTVYARKVYANGGVSDTQKLIIHPVTQYLTGEMSIDKSTKQLLFTPTSGPETYEGAEVYAYAYQNGEGIMGENSTGELIKMESTYGGWACPLTERGANYRVFTINSAGSLWAGGEDDYVYQRAPWFGGGEGYTDNGDGTYSVEVYLSDDKYDISNEGIALNIDFNPEYSNENFAINVKKDMFDKQGYYRWRSSGKSPSGIYKAVLSLGVDNHDAEYLYIKLDGVVKQQEAEIQTAQTMNVSISATDACGYTTVWSSGDQTVTYKQPEIVSHSLGKHGLIINFNQAVLPTESWAWHEGDIIHPLSDEDAGYSTEWEGAFPIVANGDYTIEYYDIFGNRCTAPITTNDFTQDGIDWSIELKFSETELTKQPVYVTGRLISGDVPYKSGLTFCWDGDKETVIVPEGRYNGTYWQANKYGDFDSTKSWTVGAKHATSSPRKVKSEINRVIYVSAQNTDFISDNLNYNNIFFQRIHIDNIAKEAPTADVRWYFTGLGQEFTQSELEEYIEENGGSVEIEGNAQVWYKTSRRVTPTLESGTEFLFTTENQDQSYTFNYRDEMENDGSVTVSLPDGLTLVEPKVPFVDLAAPTVSVGIMTKISGKYYNDESFLASENTDSVKQKFEKAGYTQSYGLNVKASDESGFAITLNDGGTAPSGVSIIGNQIYVNEAQSFDITVTDKSPQANKTTVSLTADMFKKLDNVAPTAEFTTEPIDRYKTKITAVLRDLDNAGVSTTEGTGATDSITLTQPESAVRVAPYTYEYIADSNGKLDFVFYDMVGNRSGTANSSFDVQGIDANPPKLTLTWTVPYTEKNAETGEVTVDYSMPTQRAVNRNVSALIDSDKPMYDVTLSVLGYGDYKLLSAGVPTAENPYRQEGTDIFTVDAAPDRITVTYTEGIGLYYTITATAANQKSAQISIDDYVNIDKEPPVVAKDIKYLKRIKSGETTFELPYAAEVTLTPDDAAMSTNYGGTEKIKNNIYYKDYGPWRPLVLAFNENGIYNVSFVDYAGNTTMVPVEISGIDRTAPELTISDRVDTGHTASVNATVNESCTLTYRNTSVDLNPGETHGITFNDNGTYELIATDRAGNESKRTIVVGHIDKILPSVSFNPNTVHILQNDTQTALDDLLNSGYTAWDDKTPSNELVIDIDKSEVKLDTAGIYKVLYTISDNAGNALKAERFVQVIGEDTVCVMIDGKLILPGETAVIAPGAHNMSLKNCAEPFSVKSKLGINGAGQMKYLSKSSLSFDENGDFTVIGKGYYTLLVTTQSRQTIRILLCVGL